LVCRAQIPVESPFARGGTVPGFVLLELAAQAAAIEVLARMHGGGPRPRIGYLARANGLSWTADGVPAGASLTASVRREDAIPPLYTYRARVTRGRVEVFAGRFSIYVDQAAD
jgi:predicted hotdog family 3-hydroxylacyl-ACP dehydratase